MPMNYFGESFTIRGLGDCNAENLCSNGSCQLRFASDGLQCSSGDTDNRDQRSPDNDRV